ncbi:MAG: tRNA (adenosine(37)-N6)-threonylcarbamoyltransferase complex ATPase subunit type 1 TsaE [bacterium TMED217]|nr:MAG: tRNA (adenosine(37)-N6)-threonylcarbamoyltransferase complex ATPase subunit type 1 TsaE [bacterium TMED217]|tara:strand:- start:25855 stop:26295 length:441 start_codon:yes stop_codon:yes gene_type:complete
MEIDCNSEFETKSFASEMAKKIKKGSIIALNGNLGSGKTTFTQGFAKGLGVEQHVGSPTFKLVSEYFGSIMKLYHVDCYRLNSIEEFLNLGGENLLLPYDGVTLIEWANIIEELIPVDSIEIKFSRFKGNTKKRLLTITGIDELND